MQHILHCLMECTILQIQNTYKEGDFFKNHSSHFPLKTKGNQGALAVRCQEWGMETVCFVATHASLLMRIRDYPGLQTLVTLV